MAPVATGFPLEKEASAFDERGVEIRRDIAVIEGQKPMDPGQVIGLGLDVAHIKSHLEALTRIRGKGTVDSMLAAGESVHVRVDNWTRRDRGRAAGDERRD